MGVGDATETFNSKLSTEWYNTTNTTNRYYIHPSDHPSNSLVTKSLDGENYATWSRSVEIALAAKNKIGFINGTFASPSSITESGEYEQWDRCNNMLLSWFVHSVSPDLVSNILFTSTAKQVWEDFRARFSQGNAPRIYQIHRGIISDIQGSLSIATYLTKLKSYLDELDCYRPLPKCQGDEAKEIMKIIEKQKEEDRLMQFLMGLNDSYNAIIGQLLLMKPPPSIREAYNLITQEEKQREIGNNPSVQNFSIAATMRNSKSPYSNIKSNSNSNMGLFCNYCKKDGHTIDECYKFHGFPPGHPRHDPNFCLKSHFGKHNNHSNNNQRMDHQKQPFHAVHAATVPNVVN